jgi:hypothetical protein
MQSIGASVSAVWLYISFAARTLKPEYLLNHVEVFYEPTPRPPELSWLREARSYSLPKESRMLLPKLPPPYTYLDGTTGVVQVSANGVWIISANLCVTSASSAVDHHIKCRAPPRFAAGQHFYRRLRRGYAEVRREELNLRRPAHLRWADKKM